LFADRKFPTSSGRVNLLTRAGVPDAAVEQAEMPREFPLLLMALSTDRSQSSVWSRKPEGPAVVTVHPDAAAGIPEGGLARLESRHGAITVQLRHDPAQRRDVALAANGGHLADGRCLNAITAARITDLGEGGALYDERVRLIALPAPLL